MKRISVVLLVVGLLIGVCCTSAVIADTSVSGGGNGDGGIPGPMPCGGGDGNGGIPDSTPCGGGGGNSGGIPG